MNNEITSAEDQSELAADLTLDSQTETEIVSESETETTTEAVTSIKEKIESVTLKNKKPIMEDNAYKQTDKQKEEDKKQEAAKPTDPQEDIKPSRPVKPTEPPTTEKPTEPPTEKPTEKPSGSGEEGSSETESPTIPPKPVPPYRYPNLIQTKEYAGFGYYQGGKWIADNNNFYVDGKKVFCQKGIDISIFQREPDKTDVGIDFKAVKDSGIDFVIIRLGARSQSSPEVWIDRYFEKNIKEATAAGLKVGVYFYSQAINETEAIEEAKMCLEAIKEVGCKVEYPVAIDVENNNSRMGKISKAQRTKNVKAFCETIIDGGYYPMIYSNQSWLDGMLDLSQLPYDIWMACYKSESSVKTVFGVDIPFTIWQYGGRPIPGIKTGLVDVNVSLVNYPLYLRWHGWNNL